MRKERKGQKTGEDRAHLSFLIKGRDGCRKLLVVACWRGFLSVWGSQFDLASCFLRALLHFIVATRQTL